MARAGPVLVCVVLTGLVAVTGTWTYFTRHVNRQGLKLYFIKNFTHAACMTMTLQ